MPTAGLAGTSAPAEGPNQIAAHAVCPSPWNGVGPAFVSFRLLGSADRVRVKVYSKALTLLGEAETGPLAAGWRQVPLPATLQQASAGLYFYALSSERSGSPALPALHGTFMVLR